MQRIANIVLFDMDNTLVSTDTVGLWAKFLDSKELMTREDWRKRTRFDADYMARRLDVNASCEFDLSLFLRVPPAQREAWRQEFFEQSVKANVSTSGLQLIREYKRQPNTIVILITATHEFLATPVAAYAQVHELIATTEEIINGQYTGKVAGTINLGEGKVVNFNQWLEQNRITAAHSILYSDSINDLPLLSHVTKPIAVDPDARLHKVARQNNWEIISFIQADQQGITLAPVLPEEAVK